MGIVSELKLWVSETLNSLYGQAFAADELTISSTKPEFEGDYTLVLFSFVKSLSKTI